MDFSQRLSASFTLGEFVRSNTATRLDIDNTPTPQVVENLRKLCVAIWQPVRDHFGAPVRISSGYRSPALNRAVKGSSSSQHMKGEAADGECDNVSNYLLARWIEKNCVFDQLILEFHKPGDPNAGWVHASYREGRNRGETLTIGSGGTKRGLQA